MTHRQIKVISDIYLGNLETPVNDFLRTIECGDVVDIQCVWVSTLPRIIIQYVKHDGDEPQSDMKGSATP